MPAKLAFTALIQYRLFLLVALDPPRSYSRLEAAHVAGNAYPVRGSPSTDACVTPPDPSVAAWAADIKDHHPYDQSELEAIRRP